MTFEQFIRYVHDIHGYKMCVPPPHISLNFTSFTKRQAKEYFAWYLSVLSERVEYLSQKCSKDLRVPLSSFDCSPESLILIWRWFIKKSKIEKTPREELEKMTFYARIFGESYINKEQYTVVSQFIMHDIGMYLGKTFIKNYPVLKWDYHTKPKNGHDTNQPVIYGFLVSFKEETYDWYVNPIDIVEGCANNYFTGKRSETDLYDGYKFWARRVKGQDTVADK